jgi:hypothetical protein
MFIYSQSSQQQISCDIPQPNLDTFTKFQSLSLLALIFTFALLGIVYAIGELSASPSIKAFVKTEYFEAVKSAVLVVGILSIISTLNSIILPLTGESDLLNAACKKALEIKGSTEDATISSTPSVLGFLYWVFYYAFLLGTLAPFTFTFGLGFSGQVFKVSWDTTATLMPSTIIEWSSPPQKFTLMNYIVNDLVYGIENALLISVGRVIILSITPVLVYQFLLPIGILLRGFPILRKVGGFLIALSIGLLVIYPSLVLFIDYPFLKVVDAAVYPKKVTGISVGTGESEPNIPDQLKTISVELKITDEIKFKIEIPVSVIISTFLNALNYLFGGVFDAANYLISSIYSLYIPLDLFTSCVAANIAQMVVGAIDLFVIFTLLFDLANIIGGKITIGGREIRGFGFLQI